jgi:hypothetical protein
MQIYIQLMELISPYNIYDTRDKLFSGVDDTGEIFIADVNNKA